MPELAETFTIANQLAAAFGILFETDVPFSVPKPKRIDQLYQSCPLIRVVALDPVYKSVSGFEFQLNSVRHQGKKMWLVEHSSRMIEVSLGMTGRFSLVPTDHDRVAFHFEDGGAFYYSDIRKFGTLHLVFAPSELAPSVCSDQSVDLMIFKIRQRPNWTIKRAITDQRLVVSGIGNYTSNELLYLSGIHPDTLVRHVEDSQLDALFSNSISLFARAVSAGGCTLRDFRDTLGNPGRFQESLLIHGKKECPRHGLPTCKSGSPTSYYCSECQPLKTSLTISENLPLTSE